MKAISRILLFAVCVLVSISAVPSSKNSSKKALLEENRRLVTSLDSLCKVVDSLQRVSFVLDSIRLVVLKEPELPPVTPGKNYTPDEVDSLMHIWYTSTNAVKSNDLALLPSSVRYTSKVSDEEMMKRLADMNAFFTLPFNNTVKDYMILYSEKMPSTMNRMLGLSEYYFPIFEQTLVKYELPVELKYLSIVESQLSPVVTSYAGARGIWQFIYTAAKAYGLKIDSFVDERLDVEKSVDAACRVLRDAYRIFGDWNLAISSYNCGAGNVQKAIRRAGSTKFWDVYEYLPEETRGYVPAFVGAMYAFNYAKEYGLAPANVGMPAATDTFHIKRNLHFQQINEMVGVPLETLKNLNPQYLHDIIPGDDGTYILRLPYKWTSAFVEANHESLYQYKSEQLMSPQVIQGIKDNPSPTSAGKSARRIEYKVKSGDCLGKIAVKYNVTVNQIMKWNNLKNSNIRAGQTLYINSR